MKEFTEIAHWFAENSNAGHETILVESLPSPNFRWQGREMVSCSTNNYLAIATSDRLVKAAEKGLRRYGVANCESRLLGGDLDIYRQVEQKIARVKRKEDAILYATGYLTNIGVLTSLVKASQVLRLYGFRPGKRHSYAYFSDELNHISIREGIRASGAERITYRHMDLLHLAELLAKSTADTKIIVTDGVFSQDGDIAPLPDLLTIAEKYDATIYIDDAHGTGVLGQDGGGITEHFGCYHDRILHMGTLSKAYGAIGGFVAARQEICDVLRLTSTAYGFTSTLPPDQAFAVSEAIDMVKDEPIRRQRLWENQRAFVAGMREHGFRLAADETPIVPVLIGEEATCNEFATRLRMRGFHVDAVQFPAVAKGQARLRVILNAHHLPEQVQGLIDALRATREELYPSAARARRELSPTLI